MASSLFQNNNPMSGMIQLKNALSAIKSGNADALAQQMLSQNPQFRQFMESTKGKTPDQIAQQYGISMNDVRSILKGL